MQFRDLKAQYTAMQKEMDSAILQVVHDCNFISGNQVTQLERALEEYVGVKHCITCANGTDALSLALMAWNIGPGDAVFVPDFTFFASGEVVSLEGATPVFVDVDEDTFNIDVDKLEQAVISVKEEGKLIPRVIVAVDLFGLPADYKKIREIADKYNLYILEDAAQGFGGRMGNHMACSFGDISTTSFFPAKPLGCYGDGGAIFTDNDEWADLMRSFHIHGKGSYKYDNVRIGVNSRLDTIQAAVLLTKINPFKDFELDAVNRVARKYSEALEGIVKIPEIPEGFYSSWAQYTITLKDKDTRDGLQAHLKEHGIPSMVYYPKPMHKQGAFSDLVFDENDFAVTNSLCERVLSLPMHPYLDEEDLGKVIQVIREYLIKM